MLHSITEIRSSERDRFALPEAVITLESPPGDSPRQFP